jgi:peptide/nickel transport system substrate-binding protein
MGMGGGDMAWRQGRFVRAGGVLALCIVLGALAWGGPVGAQSTAQSRGQSLVIVQAQDPQNWDPIATFLLSWGMVGCNVFDGLVDRGPDLVIRPGLATSWKWVSSDVLQFKLRRGVTFHDGEPFDADAVKFTFDRLLGPEGAKGPQQGNYKSIDHAQVVDPYTVNLVMKEQDPVIITKLAGYGAMIVPPKYVQEHGSAYFGANPVGTGPFKFVEYRKDDHLTLAANANYWGGAPKLSAVTYRFVPEAATRVAELQAGRADIVPGVPVAQANVVKNDGSLTLMTVGSPTVTEIRFDPSKAPAGDVRFRKAVIAGIDVQTIIQTILGGYGRRVSTFQSPLSFGNDPSMKPYPYDPTQAKQLLAEAGVKPGTEIALSFPSNNADFREAAQAMVSYLQAIGLKLTLQPVEQVTYFSDTIPHAKTGQIYEFGWGGWTLDFDNTADLLYHKGEFWNPVFSDADVEKYLTQERTTNDQKTRLTAFYGLDHRLYDLAIDFPLWQQINLWGVNKRVQGFVAPPDDRVRLVTVSVK